MDNKIDFIVIRGELAKKIIRCLPEHQRNSDSVTMSAVQWTPEIIIAIGYLFVFVCIGVSTLIALFKDYTCKIQAKDVEVIFERSGHEKN